MDFTLETAEAQWVQDTVNKVMEELRQTTPNGRAFAETVSAILEREKNWVKWKNELCAPFDKEPWSVEMDGKKVGLLESTRDVRAKMREPPKEWEHKLGSGPLTDIWDMGCRGLEDLQNPFQLSLPNIIFMDGSDCCFRPGDVKDFVKRIKQEDQRIEMRRKLLAKRAATQREAAMASSAPDKTANASSSKVPEPSVTADVPSSTLPIPRPTTINGTSQIHPSLPPRPGSSPLKPPSSSSQPLPTPTGPAAATAVTPVPVPKLAPSEPPPPPPPTTDKEILKFEEVTIIFLDHWHC
jgi:THO complex subunit 1